MSGQNVFVQQKMKEEKLKIGTKEYKEKFKSISNQWSRMTDEEKTPYLQAAEEQSRQKRLASKVPLSETLQVEEMAPVPLDAVEMTKMFLGLKYHEAALRQNTRCLSRNWTCEILSW